MIGLGGRSEFSDMSIQEKNLILLAKHFLLINLLLCQDNKSRTKKTENGRIVGILAKIRPYFRTLKAINLSRSLRFAKDFSKHADQITARLFKARVNAVSSFSVNRFDFAGSNYLKIFKQTQQFYIDLFTCGATRFLHLEFVSDMTTNSFLLAFRRFAIKGENLSYLY